MRLWALTTTLALSLSFLSTFASPRKNAIFLLLDDMDSRLGALDVMPTYAQRFREEGATLTGVNVAAPKCCPSRTSLLTGRFPHNLGDESLGWCGDFISAARYDAMFMANLSQAGYRVGLFGKLVNDMGIMCRGTKPHVPRGFNLTDGDAFVAMCNEVVYYENTFNDDGALFTTGPETPSGENYLMSWLGNKTIPWLALAASEAAAGGKPFFAYLAPHAPHFPAQPARWYENAALPSEIAPRLPPFDGYTDGKSWALRENAAFGAQTRAGIDLHFRNRQRSLMSVDDYVRDIFAALEAAGVLDETYIIATSDHGKSAAYRGACVQRLQPALSDSHSRCL